MSRVCNRCIMTDKADDKITFDENGNCNYCTEALNRMQYEYFPNEVGKAKLEEMIAMLKENGKGKKYDCMMGISGGLDSSYLAYLGKLWGLRILAVHIDDGFDTDLAKKNIENLVKACNIDLITINPDSEQFNQLTLAFFRASLANLAIPQDNVLFAALYKHAVENDIKYFLSGQNFALECILQRGNSYHSDDVVHIKSISKKFSNGKLDKLPLISWSDTRKLRKKHGISTLCPLNYIDYNKQKAIDELKEFCDYNYYEAKHYESKFTRFYQMHYLPVKFGVDKRTSHLSSIVIAGQMTRDEALKEMEKPLIKPELLEQDIQTLIENLNITKEEYDRIMALPGKQHTEYKNDLLRRKTFYFLARVKRKLFKRK